MNLIKAYDNAYQLALRNSSIWLDISKSAYNRGYFGQAYSLSIIAYEEIGKAFVSWLAAESLIPPDDEDLDKIYRYHEAKVVVSLALSAADLALILASWGLIDWDDALKDAVLNSEEEIVMEILSDAIEIEDRRKEGVYVDVWEKENGFSVTAPFDFDKNRSMRAIEEVERLQIVVDAIIKIVTSTPEARDRFKEALGKSRESL